MIAEKTKERPIIFTGESPKWILDGRKTQTRRTNGLDPINLNSLGIYDESPSPNEFKFDELYIRDDNLFALFIRKENEEHFEIKCPYGKPGDHLWVRETWGIRGDGKFLYKADGDPIMEHHKWKPSIHMPRKYSRINLEITNIRVERLQDISNNDALFEGCIDIRYAGNEAELFKKFWDSINKKRGYGWDTNPWIWAPIEFRIIK